MVTKIKDASTLNANREIVLKECPVTYVMARTGGHWKPIILSTYYPVASDTAK